MPLNTLIKTDQHQNQENKLLLEKIVLLSDPKFYLDQIDSINEIPKALDDIKLNLIRYHEEFNALLHILGVNRDSIISSSKEKLTNLKKEHDHQIYLKNTHLITGAYINDLIDDYKKRLNDNINIFIVFQWMSVICGVYMLFAVKWYLGLLTGFMGYIMMAGLISSNKSKVYAASTKSTYSSDEILKLKAISSNLKDIIEGEEESLSEELKSLKKKHKIEFKNAEVQENLILAQKLLDFDEQKDNIIKINLNNVTNSIIDIQNDLITIEDSLNKFPETFNPKNTDWTKLTLLKNKAGVTNILRIGYENISVDINGHSHEIGIPVCLSFLNKSNLIFNCNSSDEIKEAIKLSYNIISRSLLCLPPSKTKFTFIDPLELGGNAAPFTPLPREIYGGMVYTQTTDIENQLTSLTRAIENVIQRYLQDKFNDIAAYNKKENEVPEPYRLLIIYNFPHGFNDSTINKLLNIMKSGPKAGVHTIMVNDRLAKLPYGFNWELLDSSNNLTISLSPKTHVVVKYTFDKEFVYPQIVDYIKKELPNASTFKVSFTKDIPSESEWWQEKSHKSYSVPIGRHAVQPQNLLFNNDDDNQALLIGKPGSGKSNLLHVIIANSLWKYSPEQLEIYLIDFKGGVEFTIYADKGIPHIRALAIESEREFGESVLMKIFSILLEREKIIERSGGGVDNIYSYNEKCFSENTPEKIMPRILLIVDEFHVFFSEDDTLADHVQSMFATIVQKGRAFGINTLFSSQTLSMRSIKPAIMGLIDIRIALMCADEDATKILDEKNQDAKDLTRPGEGIYNDMGGKKEGNKKFQAFFIEKEELNKTITKIVSFAQANTTKDKKFKQIIFRGSEKAIMEKQDHPLNNISTLSSPKVIRLWVGEPVAIADDVTVVLRKQGGSNLLIAGYDESIGLRIMCSSIISIFAQQPPKSSLFYSFNFYNVDSDLISIPDDLFNSIENECIKVTIKKVKETLQKIKEEVENRHEGKSSMISNIYLCFFSFQRGRMFRLDNYENNDNNALLAYILKDGPDVGVFTLLQTDTIDNLNKNMELNLITEFSQRITSQINEENSVRILGNQKAAKLGPNRGLFYDDNENKLVKFKPYELPALSWVSQLHKTDSTLS